MRSDQTWDRLYDIAYEATIGFAKLYRDRTLSMVKATAASAYLQAIRVLRKHAQLLFISIFAAITLSLTVVVVPIALVIVSDWGATQKVTAVALLGIVDLAFVLTVFRYLYSEERWMKNTGFQDLLDSIDLPQK